MSNVVEAQQIPAAVRNPFASYWQDRTARLGLVMQIEIQKVPMVDEPEKPDASDR
jgi:hypothetical protein